LAFNATRGEYKSLVVLPVELKGSCLYDDSNHFSSCVQS